ncbi:hypothetical protein ACTWPT_12380 [Nonomuraea sp. 3N208]|uniref:hypothetical protein n=1 Tax=Nonomuraea sp. 3N208 TaxID=3457421 RepID=UPI003FCCD3CD
MAETVPVLTEETIGGVAIKAEEGNEMPDWCLPAAANVHPIPRDGRRHTGVLERILRREWDPNAGPPPQEIVRVTSTFPPPSTPESSTATALATNS